MSQLKTKEEIADWLERHNVSNYSFNYEDLSIDVEGSVDISNKGLSEIPVQFRIVFGTFNCSMNKLTSLLGSPNYVGLNFEAYSNELTSLEFGPQDVGMNYSCSGNKLINLEFCPTEIRSSFLCNNNLITTLKYSPEWVGLDFECLGNPIATMEGFNCEFGGYFFHNGSIILELKECYELMSADSILSVDLNDKELQTALSYYHVSKSIEQKDNSHNISVSKKNKLKL